MIVTHEPDMPEEGALYGTPSGRRCRWVPYREAGRESYLFEYVDGRRLGIGRGGDQFTMSRANLRLLRPHAPAR